MSRTSHFVFRTYAPDGAEVYEVRRRIGSTDPHIGPVCWCASRDAADRIVEALDLYDRAHHYYASHARETL